jgi:restriction endonuclease Mrr
MYEDIERPLLKELHRRGGAARPGDSWAGKTIYESLGEYFGLTKENYEETVVEPATGTHRSKWENMIRWARRKLVDRGYLDNSQRGVWTLTQKGLREVEGS